MKEVLPWLVRWACHAGMRNFLSWLFQSTQYFFPHFLTLQYSISILLSPSPSNMGSQLCWVACLRLCLSGAAYLYSVGSGTRKGRGQRAEPSHYLSIRIVIIFLPFPLLPYAHIVYVTQPIITLFFTRHEDKIKLHEKVYNLKPPAHGLQNL